MLLFFWQKTAFSLSSDFRVTSFFSQIWKCPRDSLVEPCDRPGHTLTRLHLLSTEGARMTWWPLVKFKMQIPSDVEKHLPCANVCVCVCVFKG